MRCDTLVDISHRPDIIDKRQRLGDWEVDSVIGKMNQSSIVTIVERASRYTAIIKVSSKEADEVSQSIVNRMSKEALPLYSITVDNGTEFSEHKKISETLGADFYFTHPYSFAAPSGTGQARGRGALAQARYIAPRRAI